VLTRIITGFVLALVVLFGILGLSQQYFEIAVFLVLLLAAWEWSSIANAQTFIYKIVYTLIAALLMIISAYLPLLTLIVATLWWAIALVLVLLYPKKKNQNIPLPLIYISGYLTIVPSWVALTLLHANDPMHLIFIILVIVLGDSGAYFIGKYYGSKPLAPAISPKKTLEGLLGGLICAGIGSIVWCLFLMGTNGFYHSIEFILLALGVVFFALLGDLYESMLKRHVGIKDSGNLLPGHGGILDRIDSVLCALPLFAVLCLILNIIGFR
jgi:phosphatidate cytidylyltransferase